MSKSRLFLPLLGTLLIVFFLGGVVAADVEETLTYQGNKARITVGKIKPKADKCTYDMAAAVGEMLSTALANNEKFIVLASQEEVAELADEIDLGQSGYVEQGKGAEKGLMEGADILVTGAVTAFEPDAGGGGGMLGGITKKALGTVGASSKNAEIRLDIKIIDIRTRRVLKSKDIKAKSKSWKVGMTGGGWVEDVAMVGAMGAYSNQPMEDAVRTALAKTMEMISKEVPDDYYRYKGQGQYTQQYAQTAQVPTTQPATAQSATAAVSTAPTAGVSAAVVAAEDMTLYTKYDFVPGNKVLFYDNLEGEEEGEFPYRWNLDKGVFEIARMNGEYWILATDDGSIRPKIPDGPLPQMYTLEMDFFDFGPDQSGNYFYIHWVDAKGKNIGTFGIYGNDDTWLEIRGKSLASKVLPQKPTKGVHTLRIMATKRSLKCYVDQVRVANVPRLENFDPVGFRVRLRPRKDPENPTLFKNLRFAEGGKSMREQLDEQGKVVTHGILFDRDSYVIKGESYKTLKDIARLLEDDPHLKLAIAGHTDSDGSDDHNLELSKNRANSVMSFLISNYGITPDRLQANGFGETQPIDANDSVEGKANNRRVELLKL